MVLNIFESGSYSFGRGKGGGVGKGRENNGGFGGEGWRELERFLVWNDGSGWWASSEKGRWWLVGVMVMAMGGVFSGPWEKGGRSPKSIHRQDTEHKPFPKTPTPLPKEAIVLQPRPLPLLLPSIFPSRIRDTMNSSFNDASKYDNLLLQSLMGRLQIRPSPPPATNSINPLLSQSLEDILLDAFTSNFRLPGSDSDSDDSNDRTQLSKEESKLEKEIIKVIRSGKTESLKPNSGQAVKIGEHYICVGFHEETGSEYRVWEWHGHVMFFDEETGYTPEYIYGNYFERVAAKGSDSGMAMLEKVEKDKGEEEAREDKVAGNLGLRELIEKGDSDGRRILHRNLNASSPRCRPDGLGIDMASMIQND
ncbi:hypothetical protein Ancab_014690 [Ancistrocladus abbreviatus]